MKALALAIVCSGLVAGHGSSQETHQAESTAFTFVRIRYNTFTQLEGAIWRVLPWQHDYPRSEKNLLQILLETKAVETTPNSHLVLDLHDPEIMKYPLLYISEPGYWEATDEEVKNLRQYLEQGGFVIFDDFRGQAEWSQLVANMKRVLPNRPFQKLTVGHPIFHCFYDIKTLDVIPPYRTRSQGEPAFWGILDDQGRVMAVASNNNDLGDYWEWSDDPLTPAPLADTGLRFGVNFVVYAVRY